MRTPFRSSSGAVHTGEPCAECGTTYTVCSKAVIAQQVACCIRCAMTDTHDEVLVTDNYALAVLDIAMGGSSPLPPVPRLGSASVFCEDCGTDVYVEVPS